MNMIELTDSLAVSGQILPQEVADIAAAGYRTILCNRPDNEEPGQPSAAVIAEAAAAAGLRFEYLPVTAMDFPGGDFATTGALLQDASQKVFAYCRSGTRCTNLWVSSCPEDTRDEAVAVARARGFDVSMAARYLQA